MELTVRELIEQLSRVKDKDKKVQVLGEVDGRVTKPGGEAVSLNPCSGVVEFDDYVAVKRVID